jgi:hypothetical protein
MIDDLAMVPFSEVDICFNNWQNVSKLCQDPSSNSNILRNHPQVKTYKESPDEEMVCVICMCDFEEGDEIKTTPCLTKSLRRYFNNDESLICD